MTRGGKTMTEERFAALAQIYGGRIDRWPADVRAAAAAFVAAAPGRAEEMLAEAAALDDLLDAGRRPSDTAASAAVLGRVLADAETVSAARRRGWGWLAGLGPASIQIKGGAIAVRSGVGAVMALCLVLGLVAGRASIVAEERGRAAAVMLTAAFETSSDTAAWGVGDG